MIYRDWFHLSRRQYIISKLKEANGNQCAAARLAGLHRNTFCRMLREEGVTDSELSYIRQEAKKIIYCQTNGENSNE